MATAEKPTLPPVPEENKLPAPQPEPALPEGHPALKVIQGGNKSPELVESPVAKIKNAKNPREIYNIMNEWFSGAQNGKDIFVIMFQCVEAGFILNTGDQKKPHFEVNPKKKTARTIMDSFRENLKRISKPKTQESAPAIKKEPVKAEKVEETRTKTTEALKETPEAVAMAMKLKIWIKWHKELAIIPQLLEAYAKNDSFASENVFLDEDDVEAITTEIFRISSKGKPFKTLEDMARLGITEKTLEHIAWQINRWIDRITNNRLQIIEKLIAANPELEIVKTVIEAWREDKPEMIEPRVTEEYMAEILKGVFTPKGGKEDIGNIPTSLRDLASRNLDEKDIEKLADHLHKWVEFIQTGVDKAKKAAEPKPQEPKVEQPASPKEIKKEVKTEEKKQEPKPAQPEAPEKEKIESPEKPEQLLEKLINKSPELKIIANILNAFRFDSLASLSSLPKNLPRVQFKNLGQILRLAFKLKDEQKIPKTFADLVKLGIKPDRTSLLEIAQAIEAEIRRLDETEKSRRTKAKPVPAPETKPEKAEEKPAKKVEPKAAEPKHQEPAAEPKPVPPKEVKTVEEKKPEPEKAAVPEVPAEETEAETGPSDEIQLDETLAAELIESDDGLKIISRVLHAWEKDEPELVHPDFTTDDLSKILKDSIGLEKGEKVPDSLKDLILLIVPTPKNLKILADDFNFYIKDRIQMKETKSRIPSKPEDEELVGLS